MGYSVSGAVVSVPLVTEVPQETQTAVLIAIYGGEDIAEALLESNLKGIDRKLRRFDKYGADKYLDGKPEGTVVGFAADEPAVTAILETKHPGKTVTITRAYVGDLVMENFVKYQLQELYGYTNLAGDGEALFDLNEPGATGNLIGSVYAVDNDDPSNSANSNLPRSGGRIIGYYESYEEIDGVDEVTIYYSELNPDGSTTPGQILVANMATPDTTSTAYEVVYNLGDGVDRYWSYALDTLYEHPELEVTTTQEILSDYLPILPLRRNGQAIYTGNSTPEDLDFIDDVLLAKEQNIIEMLNRLGVSMEELSSNLEENPDIDSIHDAYFMFGVSLYSEEQPELEYLYEFFTDATQYDVINNASEYSAAGRELNIVSVKEIAYDNRIIWGYSEKVTVTGSHAAYTATGDVYEREVLSAADSATPYREYTLRKQISPTEYEQITLFNLKGQSRITYHGDKQYLITTDIVDITGVADDDVVHHVVPLSMASVKAIDSLNDRRDLIYRSMGLQIYALTIVKLKWYQSGIFADLVKIFGIALAIFTMGTSLLAAASVSMIAVAVAIIQIAVTQIVIDYAVSWIKTNVKGWFGEFIDTIYLIVSLYVGKMDFKATFANFAENLMKVVNVVSTAIKDYVSAGVDKLIAEALAWEDEKEAWEKEIEEAEEALGKDRSVLDNPAYLWNQYEPVFVLGESPQAFYNRAIHQGNIGVLSKDYARNFVGSALTLPSFSASVANLTLSTN